MRYIYPALVHSDPDGSWVEFPDLSGCYTQGDTYAEILDNAEDVLHLCLFDILRDGKTPPEASDPTTIHTEPNTYLTLVSVEADFDKTLEMAIHTPQADQWVDVLFELPREEFENLDAYTERFDQSVSDFIRDSVAERLRKEQFEKPASDACEP